MDNNNFAEDGISVDVGFGKTLTFSPLTWGAMRKLRKQWDTIFDVQKADPGSEGWNEAMADLLYASAARSTPVAKDEFLELLDMRNMKRCFQALLEVNGMRKKEQPEGEGDSRPTSPLTGATSTTA